MQISNIARKVLIYRFLASLVLVSAFCISATVAINITRKSSFRAAPVRPESRLLSQ